LQNILVTFQWFPLAPGFSVRHKCDMKRVTAQQASDFVLGSELERLGVFERNRIDSQPFAAVEREARAELLGVGDLRDRKETPRHRPPGIDSPLLRDSIVQAVLFERVAHPKKQMKAIVIDVGAYHGVSRSYIFRCLKEVAPERRRQMVESILKFRYFGEALALFQIFPATAAPEST